MIIEIELFSSTPFWLAAATVTMAGLVRGFSGFGTAMIIVPMISALYSPVVAVPFMVLVDSLIAVVLGVRAVPQMRLQEVLPLSAAAIVTLPLGAIVLTLADPTLLRWSMSGLILLVVIALASGWRYHGRPSLASTLTIGATSGTLSGSVGIGGPPIILFWLGGQEQTATIRANIIGAFAFTTASALVTFYSKGLFAGTALQLAVILTPLYGLSVWVGTLLFPFATQEFFRRLALTLVAFVAVSSVVLG